MRTTINREQPFQVLATNFSIGPSSSGYDLQISADGINFTTLFSVGANVTRMVTGVANGSTYRLEGNTDEDVVINWTRQCNDGQGGGGGSYILPPATQSTLGGVKVGSGITVQPDGTISAEGGSGEGVVYVTHLSDAEAVAAPVGSLIVLNNESTKYAEATWANNTLTLNYAGLEDEAELEIARWEYYAAWFYLYASNGGFIIRKTRDGYESVDYSLTGDSGTIALDNFEGTTNTATYTNSGSQLIVSFSNNIDNHYLIDLSMTNEHMIYIKVEGGEVAHWNGYNNNQGTEPFQIIYDDYEDFVNFADGKSLISFKYIYGGEYRHIVVDKEAGALILYENDLVTEVARAAYLGNEVRFPASQQSGIRGIYVNWKKDEISFRLMDYTQAANILSFATEGVHYHRITDPTKATAQDLGLGTGYANGIPEWNNEGVIVRKYMNVSSTGLQFNTNASEYSSTGKITILTDGTNNGPKRIFVPTAGGTSGQILVSNGDNAAPTFQDWIKAVKITSDAYEALATKDPNTLYLIVDE